MHYTTLPGQDSAALWIHMRSGGHIVQLPSTWDKQSKWPDVGNNMHVKLMEVPVVQDESQQETIVVLCAKTPRIPAKGRVL